MTRPIRSLCCALALLVASSAASPAVAQRKQPIPEVTVATDAGDASLASLQLEGQWLIVYVGGSDSTPSARLLEALAGWDLQQGLARILVIVGDANPQAVRQAWGDRLPQARWAADSQREAARALKLRGAPTLIGLRGGSLEWILAGVLNDPTMLRDVVKSWLP